MLKSNVHEIKAWFKLFSNSPMSRKWCTKIIIIMSQEFVLLNHKTN
jgi:hypothetical protein